MLECWPMAISALAWRCSLVHQTQAYQSWQVGGTAIANELELSYNAQ